MPDMLVVPPYVRPTWTEIVQEYLRRWPNDKTQLSYVKGLREADSAFRSRHRFSFEGSLAQEMDRSHLIHPAHIPSYVPDGPGVDYSRGHSSQPDYAAQREFERRNLLKAGLPHVDEVKGILALKTDRETRRSYLYKLRERISNFISHTETDTNLHDLDFDALVDFVRRESLIVELSPEEDTSTPRDKRNAFIQGRYPELLAEHDSKEIALTTLKEEVAVMAVTKKWRPISEDHIWKIAKGHTP